MAEVTELVTRFTFQGDPSELDTYSGGLRTATVALSAMTAAATAGAAALGAMLSSAEEDIAPLKLLADRIDDNIVRMQELQYAAEQTGGGAEELRDTLSEIAVKAGEAAIDGQSEAFDLMGISVKNANGEVKTATALFGEMQEKFREMDGNKRIAVSDIMGLDRSSINLLSTSADEMARLSAEARAFGVVTDADAKKITDYRAAVDRSTAALKGMRNTVAVAVAPAFSDLANLFTEFVVKHGAEIREFIKSAVDAFLSLMDTVKRLSPILLAGAGAMIAFKLASGGMASAWAAMTGPIGVAIAGIVLAGLVIDDLIVAFNGGNSAIREWILTLTGFDIVPVLKAWADGFEAFADVVKGIFSNLWDFVKGVFSGFGDILSGNGMEGLEKLEDAFVNLLVSMKNLWWDTFSGLFSGLADKFNSLTDSVIGWFSGDDDSPAAAGPGGAVPYNYGLESMGDRPGTAGGMNLTQSVDINVTGSDANANAATIRDALQDQMRDAQTQASRGGR